MFDRAWGIRGRDGQMLPLSSVVRLEPTYGPDPVVRYNGYPAADMQAGINPALMSSQQAIVQIKAMAASMLPQGMQIEWTGLTFQEVTQGSMALLVTFAATAPHRIPWWCGSAASTSSVRSRR